MSVVVPAACGGLRQPIETVCRLGAGRGPHKRRSNNTRRAFAQRRCDDKAAGRRSDALRQHDLPTGKTRLCKVRKGQPPAYRTPAAPMPSGNTTCRRAKRGYTKYGRGGPPHTERPGRRRRSGPPHRTAGSSKHLKCGFLCRLFCGAEYFVYICRLITRMGERFY